MSNTSHAVLFFLILTSVASLALLFINVRVTRRRLHRVHKDYQEEVRKMTEDRDKKLFGQSKYSELGMMSAGIAHEINNPLAVIQAKSTQLLRMYRDPSKQKELGEGLQQILYTSERINRTVQGIREFIRHDDKHPDQEIPLKKIIDDVLAFCGQRFKNHGVNLRFYDIENFKVIGNKVQIEQIFLNLLNNAFDAIEFLPEKWIEISAQETGDKLQIYIKDSGTGIPADIAKKIMEPFYSTKDAGKGTGLGLALARGIAEKHGGGLSYVNKANHTTFLLEFPRPRNRGDNWRRQNSATNTRELH
jgi:C4-dicarboxylate-specific signal transduction histidine kinase